LLGVKIGCDLNFAKVILYETVTFTGNAVIPLVNSNRQSSNTSGIVVHSSFTVAPNITGASIVDVIATLGGSGVGNTSMGGEDSGDGFFILKKNTKYLLRVSNEDGDTANILLKIPLIETILTD
jgi:hypothetical protein